MWADGIAETRRRFEPRRRIAFARWAVAAPGWIGRDPLGVTYEHQERLFLAGRVVWASFIQANSELFEDGPSAHPAMVLYGSGGELDARAPDLRDLAMRLYDLKGTAPADPAVRAFADAITDEKARNFDLPLPRALSRGLALVATDTVVHREHLPSRRLVSKRPLPLLVDPTTHASLVLPWEYWAPDVLRAWEAA